MTNQLAIPSTGAGAALSPQPVSAPYNTGTPKEGPRSALVFLTIPAGQISGNLTTILSQYGMSMVQSVLADNEANPVAITVQARAPDGVKFGIQPGGTQIFPIFTAGTTLYLQVVLASVQASPVTIAFQLFNTWVPPSTFFAELSVAGNVNILSGGTISVTGSTVSISGLTEVGVMAVATGGALAKFLASLSNAATSVKNSATASFKGLSIDNSGSAAGVAVYVQLFDAALPGGVTVGTTAPKLSFVSAGQGVINVPTPPEGIAFTNGIQIAATTTPAGAGAPVFSPNVNVFYA